MLTPESPRRMESERLSVGKPAQTCLGPIYHKVGMVDGGWPTARGDRRGIPGDSHTANLTLCWANM
jgi:hypothetical protein